MRRRDKQVRSRRQINAIIRGSLVCRLALAKAGRPYLVPVSFGYDGRAIYFHTALEGTKLDFFQANPRVCFEFERRVELRRHPENACRWTMAYESVVGDGVVAELRGPKRKQHGLTQVMRHYSGKTWRFDPKALAQTRVWKIIIASLTGKRSPPKRPRPGRYGAPHSAMRRRRQDEKREALGRKRGLQNGAVESGIGQAGDDF
jgi:uncharacterized protein